MIFLDKEVALHAVPEGPAAGDAARRSTWQRLQQALVEHGAALQHPLRRVAGRDLEGVRELVRHAAEDVIPDIEKDELFLNL